MFCRFTDDLFRVFWCTGRYRGVLFRDIYLDVVSAATPTVVVVAVECRRVITEVGERACPDLAACTWLEGEMRRPTMGNGPRLVMLTSLFLPLLMFDDDVLDELLLLLDIVADVVGAGGDADVGVVVVGDAGQGQRCQLRAVQEHPRSTAKRWYEMPGQRHPKFKVLHLNSTT